MKTKIRKPEMTPEMKAYFRAIGSTGGKKAAAAMTPKARAERAKKAVNAREAKRQQKETVKQMKVHLNEKGQPACMTVATGKKYVTTSNPDEVTCANCRKVFWRVLKHETKEPAHTIADIHGESLNDSCERLNK